MFLVCSVASVVNESINMAKKENIWTMISHWLPLYDSTYLRSSECSCQLDRPSLQRRNHSISNPCYPSFSLFKNHIVTLSNMIKTIMHFHWAVYCHCAIEFSCDLWICLLGFIHLTTVKSMRPTNLKKCSVIKIVDYNSAHKLLSNLNFSC